MAIAVNRCSNVWGNMGGNPPRKAQDRRVGVAMNIFLSCAAAPLWHSAIPSPFSNSAEEQSWWGLGYSLAGLQRWVPCHQRSPALNRGDRPLAISPDSRLPITRPRRLCFSPARPSRKRPAIIAVPQSLGPRMTNRWNRRWQPARRRPRRLRSTSCGGGRP